MITGAREGNYIVEIDESGDEVISLDERAAWALPADYRQREVELMAENIRAGHSRADLAVSRNTLHATVQHLRGTPSKQFGVWGEKFFRDPRAFSAIRKEDRKCS